MEIGAEPVKQIRCRKCEKSIDTSKARPFQVVTCPGCGIRLAVPGRIGDIVLLKELGKGAMGVVYRGVEQNLGRSVAVKILKQEKGNKENQDRIESTLAEARSLASLNHPNVVQVFSIDLAKSNPYIVMEMVDGGRLDEMIKQGAIEEARALEIILEVAEGLNAALGVGLVHGDVKPANVLMDKQGICKLIDFGIAHSLESEEGSDFLGTPYFVAPEIVRREKIDHRADIFSLGVTLYQSLTGERPYSGENVKEIIKARMDAPAPSVRDINRQLHPRTAAVVARMLERQTLDRHQTYDDLITDLAEALQAVRLTNESAQESAATQLIPAGQDTHPADQTQGSSDRKASPITLIAGLVLLGAIGFGGGVWWFNSLSQPNIPDDDGGTSGTTGLLTSGSSGTVRHKIDTSWPDHFFSYTDFTKKKSIKLLQLNGDAKIKGRRLVLTEDRPESRSSVFYRKRVQLSHGFMTWFRFRINSGSGKPADGFAFIIQDDSVEALGSKGSGLGYAAAPDRKTGGEVEWTSAIKKGLAVEFDTFPDDPTDRPGIAVHASSKGALSAAANKAIGGVTTLPFDITDGKIYLATIRYDAKTQNLLINLFDTGDPARNASKIVHVPLTNLDGKSIFDKGGKAWIGFSAGTGGESEAHQILGWSFASARVSLLTDGLVGHWPLNGNARDTSGTRANGQLRGKPRSIGSPMVGMGSVCEVLWQGKWYPSKVLKTEGSRWFIKYDEDDDSHNEWVGKNRIRFKVEKNASGYQLDGAKDYIEIGDPQGLNIDGNVTMAAWIKPQADRGKQKDSGYMNIITRGSMKTAKREVFLRIASGKYEVGVWNGQNHLTSWPIPKSDLGKWVHLAGVYDGSAWRLYRNGLKVSSTNDSVGAINLQGGWAIGRSSTTSTRHFKGAVDDVHLFKRALKPEEIMWLALADLRPATIITKPRMDKPKVAISVKRPKVAVTTLGLVGHWPLNDVAKIESKANSGLAGKTELINIKPAQWVSESPPNSGMAGSLRLSGRASYVETHITQNMPQWTICAWVKGDHAPLSGKPDGPVHRNGNFHISWHHQNPRFRGAALIRIKKVWHAAGFGQLNAKIWYHLAATYDGHTLKAYVNGRLINSNDQMEGRADAETETLKIGRHALYKNYFRGWVQDVRLYNRALKADEMAVFGSGG